MDNILDKSYASFLEETLRDMVSLPVEGIGIVVKLMNTPDRNRQLDRSCPTPVPLKSYTLSAGPTPSV